MDHARGKPIGPEKLGRVGRRKPLSGGLEAPSGTAGGVEVLEDVALALVSDPYAARWGRSQDPGSRHAAGDSASAGVTPEAPDRAPVGCEPDEWCPLQAVAVVRGIHHKAGDGREHSLANVNGNHEAAIGPAVQRDKRGAGMRSIDDQQ